MRGFTGVQLTFKKCLKIFIILKNSGFEKVQNFGKKSWISKNNMNFKMFIDFEKIVDLKRFEILENKSWILKNNMNFKMLIDLGKIVDLKKCPGLEKSSRIWKCSCI